MECENLIRFLNKCLDADDFISFETVVLPALAFVGSNRSSDGQGSHEPRNRGGHRFGNGNRGNVLCSGEMLITHTPQTLIQCVCVYIRPKYFSVFQYNVSDEKYDYSLA